MAVLKLPRLKANLAIVNGQGKPTDFFLRLFNLDFAQRLEVVINEQQDLIDQIIAAQAAADAAQATADAALAAASDASGAKYTNLDAAAGASTATSTVNDISPMMRLQLIGQLRGGTLDADATWNGEAEFFESDGVTTNSLGVFAIATASTGLSPLPGEWGAEDSSVYDFDVVGTLVGTVTYSVTVTRTGGSNYVQGASISSVLTLTPKVAP